MHTPATRRKQRGLTLVELIVAFTILGILTMMAVPLARYKVRRDKEIALQRALDEIRKAIDNYKDASDQNMLGAPDVDTFGYPKKLDDLVEGVKMTGSVDKKIKFLRRIPKDPFTNSTDWGKRSMQDDPTAQSWGGQNVFDVYTKTTEKARDGTSYSDW
ncbi:MAG TPA: type II secretion system protein [Bryobacteraceae bacterium]|nr:type II secretion system protein [Bryobacteraceae bacterium]